MKCPLGISNFLEEISSLSHSIVLLYFFALIAEEDFLISPCFSLELCIQMGISFLFSFAFHFFSQLFVRPHQTTILPFCISFSWGWAWSLPPVQCHKPPSIVLQALCLSDLIPWIYLSVPLYNHKRFDLGHYYLFDSCRICSDICYFLPDFYNCPWAEYMGSERLCSQVTCCNGSLLPVFLTSFGTWGEQKGSP